MILACDVGEKEVGAAASADRAALTTWLNTAFPVADRAGPVISTTTAFLMTSINNTLKSRPVGSLDTVFVYVCSNGIHRPGGTQTIGSTSIGRSTVLSAIQALNPRLSILITDCYNAENTTAPNPANPPFSANASFGNLINDLFFASQGTVDINSFSEGGQGWASRVAGGLFTQAFVDVTSKGSVQFMNTPVNWNDAFNAISQATQTAFGTYQMSKPNFAFSKMANEDALKASQQTPVLNSVATPISSKPPKSDPYKELAGGQYLTTKEAFALKCVSSIAMMSYTRDIVREAIRNSPPIPAIVFNSQKDLPSYAHSREPSPQILVRVKAPVPESLPKIYVGFRPTPDVIAVNVPSGTPNVEVAPRIRTRINLVSQD